MTRGGGVQLLLQHPLIHGRDRPLRAAVDARAERRHRELVGGEQLESEQRDRDDRDRDAARAGGDQRADQHRVDEAQQEHREQHPALQTAVPSERTSL